MRCKALLLAALLVSGAAVADPPASVPTDAPIDVRKGDPAPSEGVFVTKAKAVEIADRCAAAGRDRDHYRHVIADQPLPSSGSLLLGAGLVGLVIGAIVGGIAVAVAKK